MVAETQMEQASSAGRQAATEQPQSSSNSSSNSSSGEGKSAFMTLAGYIFGKNDRQEKMAMTMPVFSDSSGRMQFFMARYAIWPHNSMWNQTCQTIWQSCLRTSAARGLVVVMHVVQHNCSMLVVSTLRSYWQAKRLRRASQ